MFDSHIHLDTAFLNLAFEVTIGSFSLAHHRRGEYLGGVNGEMYTAFGSSVATPHPPHPAPPMSS